MEPHYYNIDVEWIEGRKGIISSKELDLKIGIAVPPPFYKGVEGIWSPEHLLTAAVSGCFMTTFLGIAENSKLDFLTFNSSAHGKLEQVDGKYLMTEIILQPVVVIRNEKDKEKTERILHKAESACLITNSIKIKTTLNAVVRIEINQEQSAA